MKRIKELFSIYLISLFIIHPFFMPIISALNSEPDLTTENSAKNDGSKGRVLSDDSAKDIRDALGRTPIHFIENRGQVDERVRYYAKKGSTTIWFTDDEVVLDFIETERNEDKKMEG